MRLALDGVEHRHGRQGTFDINRTRSTPPRAAELRCTGGREKMRVANSDHGRRTAARSKEICGLVPFRRRRIDAMGVGLGSCRRGQASLTSRTWACMDRAHRRTASRRQNDAARGRTEPLPPRTRDARCSRHPCVARSRPCVPCRQGFPTFPNRLIGKVDRPIWTGVLWNKF